ncbi:MAG: hypothetical protein ACREUY_04810 [Burkholderiales bacterium]
MKPDTVLSLSIPAEALVHTAYEKKLAGFLFEPLTDTVERFEPQIVPMLRGGLREFDLPPARE